MIAFLRGVVLEKGPSRVVVDVGGVGYDVHVPLSTFYEVADAGGEVALRIHVHVREDALQLFGFLTELEQQLFERLIGISGVGPRLAVSVLSGMDTHELLAAVQRGDVARLTGIPGVGKKTAERIVLELKDRVARLMPSGAPERTPATAGDRLRADLLSALQNLGYHRPQAEKAVESVLSTTPDATFEQALRGVLRELLR